MPTEIRRVDPYSMIRVVTPIIVIISILGLLPMIFDFMAARTPLRFAIDAILLITGIVIGSAFLVGISAAIYNVVAYRVGGISVKLVER